MNYEGEMIDHISTLYESLYGHSKYRDWKTFNECLPLVSAYGIVSVNTTHSLQLAPRGTKGALISSNKMLKYLSSRQKSTIPFLHIHGIKDKRLVHQKLNELVANQMSMTNQTVFKYMSKQWNMYDVSIR